MFCINPQQVCCRHRGASAAPGSVSDLDRGGNRKTHLFRLIHRGIRPPSGSQWRFSRSRDKSRESRNRRRSVGVHFFCGVCDLQCLTVGLDFGTAFAFGSHYLLTARHNIEPFPDLREKRSFTGVWLTEADGEKEQRHSISTLISYLEIHRRYLSLHQPWIYLSVDASIGHISVSS